MGLSNAPVGPKLGACYRVLRVTASMRSVFGGFSSHTFGRPVRYTGALAAVAPAVRREARRADAPWTARGLRDAVRALRIAPARLLPSHARLARGRRGRAAGGVCGGLQRDARRPPADQRPPGALPDRAQPLAEP